MLLKSNKYAGALFRGFLLLTLVSCSGSIPMKKDYLGRYTIIKVRENGVILNIDTLSQIELTDELYISGLDRNEDNQIGKDEITATSYVFHLDEDNNPYIKINDNDTIVELLPDHYYDLLLKRIDQLGNETVIYLKK